MNETIYPTIHLTPAGYEALIERFQLEVIPNWHESFIADIDNHSTEIVANKIREIYPAKYHYNNMLGEHLEFAIKNDGVNPAILAAVFQIAPRSELTDYIVSKLYDNYARCLWYWFEFLTGEKLTIDDLTTGDYIPLLEPNKYYTISNPQPISRQRIYNNLIGNAQFCPIVRRTDCLNTFEKTNFSEQCRNIISKFTPQLLKRGTNYLYKKETKSSFELEHIYPNSNHIEQLIQLLQLAEEEDFCKKNKLIWLQHQMVDSRFRDTDFRRTQNYIGESLSWTQEKVHFVAPKPDDLAETMEGFFVAHNRMSEGGVSAVIHAAVISYGLVFLHPFEDGNGRLHRFLIHNILAQRGFTPSPMIFPVSAAMLKNSADYNASLESFSQPLMELVDYVLDSEGRMTVQNETINYYRFNDMTTQAEWLFRFIERTIETELGAELTFLTAYDLAKKSVLEIVADIPDKKIDLLIQSCIQNNGLISLRKRRRYFEFLTDNQVAEIESVIQTVFKLNNKNKT
ncbi:MAG: Fic family protein [Planctomycetaceae bacterium]|nr:Fic family protein [Planctomycetaceae bacterium]